MVNKTGLVFVISFFLWVVGLIIGYFYNVVFVIPFLFPGTALLEIVFFVLFFFVVSSLFLGYLTPLLFFGLGLFQGSLFLEGASIKIIFRELARTFSVIFASFLGLGIAQAFWFEFKNLEPFDFIYMRKNIVRSLVLGVIGAVVFISLV